MSVISDVEAAVLGLVCEGPHYGYELEKVIEERRMRTWTEIGFSSIYYVLKRLEGKKLVASKGLVKGGRSRRVYTITESGRKAMKAKTRFLLSNYMKSISSFDLGIINIWLLGTGEALECLRLYERSVDERVARLEDTLREMDKSKSPYFVKGLFTRPLAHLKTEKSWVVEFSLEIKNRGTSP